MNVVAVDDPILCERIRIAEQAATILRSRLSDPPDVPTLCMLVGLNRNYLQLAFVQLYGETMAAYSRRMRLEHAQDLLVNRNRTLEQVARATGFATVSAFSIAFQHQFGFSPRQWRLAYHQSM